MFMLNKLFESEFESIKYFQSYDNFKTAVYF